MQSVDVDKRLKESPSQMHESRPESMYGSLTRKSRVTGGTGSKLSRKVTFVAN